MEYPSRQWVDLLPDASAFAQEFVAQLVKYQGSKRMTAEMVRSRL